MIAPIQLFLAPTTAEARHAAWQHVLKSGVTSLLDPPVIFTASSEFSPWRDFIRDQGAGTVGIPRLIRPEDYFARSQASMARQRFLSGTDRAWVLSEILRDLSAIESFGNLTAGADFPHRFSKLIGRLRQSGLERFPAGEMGDALNQLLELYEDRLATLNVFDYEAAPTLFARSTAPNRSFTWPNALIVDDLVSPPSSLQAGLRRLFERASVVVGALVCPGGVEGDAALQGALEFWRSAGAEIVQVGDFISSTSLASARLLGGSAEVDRPQSIALTAAHTPWDEMNRIAATIRARVEAGASPDEFTVAFADFDGYEAIARHAFKAHGVPLDWPRPTPLRNSPLIRALLQVMGSRRIDRDARDIHELFGAGILQIAIDERVFDSRRLLEASRTTQHYDLSDLPAAREAFAMGLKQSGQTHRESVQSVLSACLEAGDFEAVTLLQSLWLEPRTRLNLEGWSEWIERLTSQLLGHWAEKEGAAAEKAQAAISAFGSAVERVRERAMNWSVEESGGAVRSVSEWLRWLELEIDNAPLDAALAGGVRVSRASAMPRAQGSLFVCGLNHGAWPFSRTSAGSGEGWSAVEEALNVSEASASALATHALAKWVAQRELSLSYASFIQGKESAPSIILDDLQATWPVERFGAWPELAPLDTFHSSRRSYLKVLDRWMTSVGASEGIDHYATLQALRTQRNGVELGAYDGVLGEQGELLMEQWRQLQKSPAISVSDLDKYAACPLRYFFETVLAIRADEAWEEDLDPRGIGNLVHFIVLKFFKAWEQPLNPANFEAALEVLAEICWAECQNQRIRPILREAEFFRLMGADQRSGSLVRWLKLEANGGAGAWPQEMRPLSQSSHAIDGVGNGLEHRFQVEVGGQPVRGTIDRLDISNDGTQLAIIDYKTGGMASLPTWKNGDDGLHFQLPVYALAARDLARSGANTPRLSMAYLLMRTAAFVRGVGQEGTLGKGCSGSKNLPDALFDEWLGEVEQRVSRIGKLRDAGTFNVSLRSSTVAKCANCGAKALCGQKASIQTVRLQELLGSDQFYVPDVREWEV